MKFKIYRRTGISDIVCLGIQIPLSMKKILSKKPYDADYIAVYYCPETNEFCNEATHCWFPDSKLKENQAKLMAEIFSTTFEE